ncbi:MAG: serine/threonine-protein kinase [Leptolyngbyaceae cyanobacterium bins.349]|nr:serine/threonine-protein kinase [Leptolyngbyaceae cyanobacterium bins.349]
MNLVECQKYLSRNLGQTPRWLKRRSTGQQLIAAIAALASVVTINNLGVVPLWERNLQTAFFDLRGAVEPPNTTSPTPSTPGIIILAMDGETMTQGTQVYPTDPKRYAFFEPIQQWPWQRTTYAIVIDRLMQAGARAVVLDVVLDAPSSYGDADDIALQRVLQKYAGRVTLAAKYIEEEDPSGYETKLLSPNPTFQMASPRLGFINFVVSLNGRIHELGKEYLRQVTASYGNLGDALPQIPSLAEAALQSAGIVPPPPAGKNIFFYGPSRTFKHVSFWHVLDPQSWNDYHLKNQTFKNKIVLIGPTGGGESFQDFHAAPFSGTLRYPEKMAGVEIQANAIATLMQGNAIAPLFSNRWQEGVFVGLVVFTTGYLQSRKSRNRRLLRRFFYGLAIALGYAVFSYALFVGGRVILPTMVPLIAITLGSVTYVVVDSLAALRRILEAAQRHRGSEEVREFLSDTNQEELQQAAAEYHRELLGSQLRDRYGVFKELAAGGFGQTYLAQDCDRPGTPTCVVKRLRPSSSKPGVMRLAENLFKREAETLERLGKHPQIPQLLAYFNERGDFYLVQEYIDGISLADELKLHKLLRPLSEQAVVMILFELLHILDFVHRHGVIHRDIKPANIIRRRSDRKLVLIDFGAVKQVSAMDEQSDGTVFTVAIGTNGYMAPEQAMGKPCAASDIYALGMTGIRALTGIEPSKLDSGGAAASPASVSWKEMVQVSDSLVEILDKMVRVDVSERYRTAPEAITALQPLVEFTQKMGFTPEFLEPTLPDDDDCTTEDETKRWLVDGPAVELPETDPVPAPTAEDALPETKPWLSEPMELPSTASDEKNDHEDTQSLS